jgi:Ca2+-binding RTX toxin-like protein
LSSRSTAARGPSWNRHFDARSDDKAGEPEGITVKNVGGRMYAFRANTLFGNGGNDELDGEDGDDRLFGDAGRDELDGGKGNDLLVGGADDDQLDGGKGNDTLIGGAGRDKLTGGDGADQFVFNAVADGVDTITDFATRGGNQDRIVFGTSVFEGFTGDDGFDLVAGGFLRAQAAAGGRTKCRSMSTAAATTS